MKARQISNPYPIQLKPRKAVNAKDTNIEAYKARAAAVRQPGRILGELLQNNLAIGLCCKASALYNRCIRLGVLLLGILTDVAICALFFYLNSGYEDQSFYFWEELRRELLGGALLSLVQHSSNFARRFRV